MDEQLKRPDLLPRTRERVQRLQRGPPGKRRAGGGAAARGGAGPRQPGQGQRQGVLADGVLRPDPARLGLGPGGSDRRTSCRSTGWPTAWRATPAGQGAGAGRGPLPAGLRPAPAPGADADGGPGHQPAAAAGGAQGDVRRGHEAVRVPARPAGLGQLQRRARAAAPRAGRRRASPVLADAFSPPFRPGQFDTVVTPWFIDIVPVDMRETLAVIHGLLAPGGAG